MRNLINTHRPKQTWLHDLTIGLFLYTGFISLIYWGLGL